MMGMSGGAGSSESDQINVLGNHYGTYDFKLSYAQTDWQLSGYYPHLFADNTGMAFRSEEHTTELQPLSENSYAVFCC